MIEETTPPVVAPAGGVSRRTKMIRIGLLLIAALGLNFLVLAIPNSWIEGLRDYGPLAYVAAFAITAIANASVVVPVPYPGVLALLECVLGNPWGLALAGAAGSTIGETTAFFVGRAGTGMVQNTAFYRWLQHQLRTPLRAFVVLFLLSAPPNPFFDIAGLTAGTLGVPFWVFVSGTFLGRIIKILFFVLVGQQVCG